MWFEYAITYCFFEVTTHVFLTLAITGITKNAPAYIKGMWQLGVEKSRSLWPKKELYLLTTQTNKNMS